MVPAGRAWLYMVPGTWPGGAAAEMNCAGGEKIAGPGTPVGDGLETSGLAAGAA